MIDEFEKAIGDYSAAFLESKGVAGLRIGRNLYTLMERYWACTTPKDQARMCELADKKIMPHMRDVCMRSTPDANRYYGLYMDFYCLSCRRNLRNFAFLVEQDKRKKIWARTADTMEPVFAYADKFVRCDGEIDLMRVSCMPGLGKSYMGNLIVAQLVGNNPNISILRITYSEDLVKITTKQTKSIINSRAFRMVFPRYAEKTTADQIFRANDNYSFCMCDCEDEFNLFGVTRDGQATGKRAKVLIIDDLLKGESEANSIQLHKQLLDRYDSEWTSRADDDQQLVMLLGTMWSNTDLLNVVYDRADQEDRLITDTFHRWTEISSNGRAAFIRIPALDPKTEQSTCPERFSTRALRKKRQNMDPYLWAAVYQQNPIAPKGRDFAWENLETYRQMEDFHGPVYATLDPARRGKNYVSMPVWKKDPDSNRYYVIDWMYKKESMNALYGRICETIIKNHVIKLWLENNTDTSLKVVIEAKLHRMNYFSCEIIEKYSTENKEQRIKDYGYTLRTHSIFPDKAILRGRQTEMREAMESLTSYSFDYPNKFDDAIDSAIMGAMNFMDESRELPHAGTFSRRPRYWVDEIDTPSAGNRRGGDA